MVKCFIFDIDGTMADITHRLHFIEKVPKQWDAFFAACDHDEPIEHIRNLMQCLNYHVAIVLASGRAERTREKTINWLVRHNFPYPQELLMRPDNDFRPDHELKLDQLKRIRALKYQPIMAFEDRSRVVDMWRENGVPCAQVAAGDF